MKFYLEKTEMGIHSEKSLKTVLEEMKVWKYLVEFKLLRDRRTLPQNSYIHWVMIPCYAEYVGHIYQWMPEFAIKQGLKFAKQDMKDIYLPTVKRRNPLDKRRIIKDQIGTSDLNTKQFADLINAIHHDMPWIPLPDTWECLNYYNEMVKRYPDITSQS